MRTSWVRPLGKDSSCFFLDWDASLFPLERCGPEDTPFPPSTGRVTTKTLTRDINALKKLGLVVVAGDDLKANLEFMQKFTARRPSSGLRLGSAAP